MATYHQVGFEEFLEDSVKSLTDKAEWMKDLNLRLITSMKELTEFVDRAIASKLCALDLETTGLSTRTEKVLDPTSGRTFYVPVNKIVGFGLSCSKDEGVYVPINHTEGVELNLKENLVLEEIKRLCQNCVIIVHNAKFDLAMLDHYEIVVNQHTKFEDTLILARLFDAGSKEIGLKHLSEVLLNQKMITFEEATGHAERFDLISPKISYVYVCCDALCTFQLFHFFMAQEVIKEQIKIYNLEKRTVRVVMEMESNLVQLDVPYLRSMAEKIQTRLEEIRKEIYKLVGKEFDIASPQQLGKILFDELGYRYPDREKTKTGQYKTDDATMQKIAEDYPVVAKISEFRVLEKNLGTYVNKLLMNVDEDGCVKLGFNQNGTDTGRFSSPGGRGINVDGYCGVNIQSLPSTDADGLPALLKENPIRRAFIARPGYKILAMDYSGEELRVATNLSSEPNWIEEFLNGSGDLHAKTAQVIFNKQNITKPERKIAKCVAKGTLIASEYGWVPIEDLKVGDKVVTHTGGLRPITKVWNMGRKDAVMIRTRSGHRGLFGVNHLFLTPSGDWVRAKNLRVGNSITTISCTNMNPVARKIVHFNFWNKGNSNDISTDLPSIEISPLWARLMGYVIGDGSVNINNVRVACSPEYEDVKNDIVATAEKLGLTAIARLYHRKGAKNPIFIIRLGSRILVRFFREIGFTGRREYKRGIEDQKSTKIFRVPRIIFESPKDVSREFLRGLFETDGTVDNTVSVTTKDSEFAEDLVLLLAQFGIRAYIYLHYSKKYNRNYYKVTFGREGSEIFHSSIGFISQKKKEKLEKIVSKEKRSHSKVAWFSEIIDTKVVSGIELMDLTVEPDHTYVAQGMVTHNTANFLTLYGGGPSALAGQAKISIPEAQRIMAAYFAGLPRLKKWIDIERSRARKQKKARTAMGRVRPLAFFYNSGDKGQEAHGDRCAVNFLIQGLCADIMKTCMVRVFNWIHREGLGNDIRILITMHDELVFEIKANKMKQYVPILNDIMKLQDILQGMLKWAVPFAVDAEYGDSWDVHNDFFKEHPDLAQIGKVEFRESGSIPPPPVPTAEVAVPPNPEVTPAGQSLETIISEPLAENPPKPDMASDQAPEAQKGAPEAISEPPQPTNEVSNTPLGAGSFVYTIRDTRAGTLRRLNHLLMFLMDEMKSTVGYEGVTKQVVIRDRQGNVLGEVPVKVDAFLALSRYLSV